MWIQTVEKLRKRHGPALLGPKEMSNAFENVLGSNINETVRVHHDINASSQMASKEWSN